MIRMSEMMRKKAERIRETVSRSVGMIGPPMPPEMLAGAIDINTTATGRYHNANLLHAWYMASFKKKSGRRERRMDVDIIQKARSIPP